jgi:hypothetical protein
MTRVKLALPVDDMFGSTGSTTYSHTRAYLVLKRKSWPGSVNPFTPSPSQVTRRSYFAASIAAWKTLTPQQIEAWCSLAATLKNNNRFDQSYYAAGFNLFLELNQNRQMINQTIYFDAPVVPSVINLLSFVPAVTSPSAVTATLTFTGQTTNANVITEIYATKSVPSGRTYFNSLYRFIGTISGGTPDIFDATTAYNSILPAPTTNYKISFRLIAIDKNTGFSSPAITAFCIVDA